MMAKIVKICLVFGCAFALLVTACKSSEREEPGAGPGEIKEDEAGVKEKTEGTVIARIANGEDVITWEELDSIYHIERMKRRLTEDQVNRLLNNLVRQHLVYLDGLEKGYDKDPEYVEQIERAKRQHINRIAMRKLSEEKIEITDEEIRAYYDEHPDDFHMLKVRYIMFSLRKYGNDAEKAKADAKKALAAIKKGMSMDDASQKFLERARPFILNLRKGQSSFFGKNFDNVVWNLEPTQTSDLIETTQGIMIAEVSEKIVQSFDEAKNYIKSVLNRKKSTERSEQYYEDLKTKYSLEIDQDALKKKLGKLKQSEPAVGRPRMPVMPTPPPTPPPDRGRKRPPP